jgi:hypothetical protein
MSGSPFTDRGRRFRHARKSLVGLTAAFVLGLSGVAAADTLGPINFESGYSTLLPLDGQHGWSNTGSYDAAIANVGGFPAASGYGFGTTALRISDATTSGSFGDQPFSPGLANEAGETAADSGGPAIGTRQRHFEVTFQIGTTQAAVQPGLHMTMSPDRGDGGRMSYLRFDDLSDGVHVYFDDVTDPGGLGTPADFNERVIATLSRTVSHTIRMTIDFNDGPNNDVVQVFVDGALVATGGSWEDYYRFDPEQTPSGNRVPTVDKVLFRESGDPHANGGQGYLIDNFGTTSSPTPTTTTPGGGAAGGVAGQTGTSAKKCKKHKRKHHAAAAKKCKRHKKK